MEVAASEGHNDIISLLIAAGVQTDTEVDVSIRFF